MQVNKNNNSRKPDSGHDRKRETAPATPNRHDARNRSGKDKAANDELIHDVKQEVAAK
ncbi:MAG TPA: hypothetical protein VIC31_11765 [Rudaea sp.]|jgi:hypothetical protein